MVWIGLVESVEGLKSKGWGFLQKQFRLQNVMQKSCLSVRPVAHLTKFRFVSPTILWTHALKRISLFLSHPDWYRIQVREYFKAVLISLSNRLKPYRGQGKGQKKKHHQIEWTLNSSDSINFDKYFKPISSPLHFDYCHPLYLGLKDGTLCSSSMSSW